MSEPLPAPRSRRLLAELPWLVGIAFGLVHLWRSGDWLHPTGYPMGLDHDNYLIAAWLAAHHAGTAFPVFRAALWPWAAGLLGDRMGYVAAAQALSSAGVAGAVVGAGLLGRALGGVWAGGVAAVLVGATPVLATVSAWSTPYAPVAGLVALALGLAATAGRSGSVFAMGGAALLGGLAAAADDRAWPIVAPALVGALAGLVVPASLPRRALFLLATGACLVGPRLEARVEIVPQAPFAWRVERQRAADLDKIRTSGIAGLNAACAGEPHGEQPSLAALRRPCATALRQANLGELRRFAPVHVLSLLAGALLALVPARRWRLGSLVSLACLGPTLAVLAVMAHWTLFSDRYVLASLAPLAALLPVGLARLASWVPARWTMPAEACGNLLLLASLGRYGFPPPLQRETADDPRGWQVLASIRARVPPDAEMLDCSGRPVLPALLPEQHGHSVESPHAVDGSLCPDWVQEAPVGGWMVTGTQCRPGCSLCTEVAAPNRAPGGTGPLSAELLRAAGWESVAHDTNGPSCTDDTGLWRRVEAAGGGHALPLVTSPALPSPSP